MTITSETDKVIAKLRQEVCDLHAQLTHYQLVIWTAGNVSARVPDRDLMVIKPSGADYDSLTADDMVVCDLYGNLVDGDLAPSSDTAAHAYVYRHMPEVGGVVHTHSTYATAWAARGEPIPCVLTMMADEFGGDVPVGPFALIGDDSIGRGIVETLRDSRSPAVLMRNHGPFTIGRTARDCGQGGGHGRGRRTHRAHQPSTRHRPTRSIRPTSPHCSSGTRTCTAKPADTPTHCRRTSDDRVPTRHQPGMADHGQPVHVRTGHPRPGRRSVPPDRRTARRQHARSPSRCAGCPSSPAPRRSRGCWARRTPDPSASA